MKKRMRHRWSVVMLAAMLGLSGCSSFGQDVQVGRLRRQAIEKQQAGEYEASVELLQSALAQANERDLHLRSDLYLYLGRAQEKMELLDQAVTSYSHALEIERTMEGFYSRGYVYLLQEKNDAAKGDFREAVLLAKDEPQLFAKVYQLFAERNQAARGADVLSALQQKLTDDQAVEKGLVYIALENYENAALWFERAIEKGYQSGYYYLGEIEKKKGNYDAAIEQYDRYEEKAEPDILSLNSKGYCLAMKQDIAGALETYRQAAELPLGEGSRDAYWNIAMLYEQQADFEQAKQAIDTLLEKYPTDEEALREKRFLESR
ncbi:MAG: tetratricopeptide repeat protein [Eubacteriales bacterium]|nr:tetratricopeptide repeat protein [Eubacteriales bacterium]